MFRRIVLLIVFTFVLPNSHLYPVGLYDEDLGTNDIDSVTFLTDTENYDYLETSTTESETSIMNFIATTVKDDDPIITTVIPQMNEKNQNKTIIFRTLAYDGPLIVEKIDYVKIAQRIPIFFRLAINQDSNKDDELVIKPLTQLEDSTTTDSSSNVHILKKFL